MLKKHLTVFMDRKRMANKVFPKGSKQTTGIPEFIDLCVISNPYTPYEDELSPPYRDKIRLREVK